jgi:nitrous oxidase accessory protein NosD
MRKIAFLIAVCGAAIWLQLCSAPAYATSTRTWVSHTGNDSNPCSESSPCLSFPGALAKTAPGGEVDCLDAGDYSSPAQAAVTFSVTIDCHGFSATNFNPGTGDGIEINAPGGIVVLRGLTFNFAGGANSIDTGIYVQAATTVHIEDCTINGFRYGIADIRTTGLTQLFIKNTVIRDNHVNANSPGILLEAAPKNSVVLENVQLLSNGYGIAIATGNNVVISRSVISGNGIAGIEADAGAQVMVDNTEISHNVSYGIYALGNVALANSDISFNTSSIFGTTSSYGNNRLFGNGGGTAPTPVGGASTDFGQQ